MFGSGRRRAWIVAVAGVVCAATAACSTGGNGGGDGSDRGDGPGGGTVTTAWEAEFSAYNNNTAEQNASKNRVVLNGLLRSFWSFGPDGTIVPDTEFGSFEKVSDSPLVVRYEIAEDAVWSDGDPVDCNDMVLTWAANSGQYARDDGEPLFSSSDTAGYEQMTKPDCEPGDKVVEVRYDSPFADWQAMFGQVSILPAHVVEIESGVGDLVAAVAADDVAALGQVAEFYNTGWTFNAGEFDPGLVPSSGPYVLAAWDPGESVTLEANDAWWGTPPAVGTVVVRFVAPEEQVAGLANGELDVVAPQPQVDVVDQLAGLGDDVDVVTGDRYTFEHLTFNFGGPFADRRLREAFALCVPRQLIVDNLVKPVNPDAQVLNSRYVFGFQPGYDDVVAAVYDGAYDHVDVAAAKQLLTDAGAVGTLVRVGYNKPNPRRQAQVALIRDSCEQAGFDVQDTGAADFFDAAVASGNFDVALFGWAGSPLVTTSTSTYTTGGGTNVGKYSSADVDGLLEKLGSTTDEDAQRDLVKQIDRQLWTDLVSVPLFAHPGVVAHAPGVEGPGVQPSQSEVTWNVADWVTAN